MKIRLDFVTNSSSSSFIIAKKCLTEDQIEGIRDYEIISQKLNLENWEEGGWYIEENKDYISGYTSMDNFSIGDLLRELNINMKDVKWDDFDFDLDSPEYIGDESCNSEDEDSIEECEINQIREDLLKELDKMEDNENEN